MIEPTQCKAGRALCEISLDLLSSESSVPIDAIEAFEGGKARLDEATQTKLIEALEALGVELIPENGGGFGVRRKLSRRDVRAVKKWEGEGGAVGEDDV